MDLFDSIRIIASCLFDLILDFKIGLYYYFMILHLVIITIIINYFIQFTSAVYYPYYHSIQLLNLI